MGEFKIILYFYVFQLLLLLFYLFEFCPFYVIFLCHPHICFDFLCKFYCFENNKKGLHFNFFMCLSVMFSSRLYVNYVQFLLFVYKLVFFMFFLSNVFMFCFETFHKTIYEEECILFQQYNFTFLEHEIDL